jgi:two-component system, NtrC family, response regulator GlrR
MNNNNREPDSRCLTPGFVGQSPAFQNVASLIQRIAASDVTVLIQGETGTGKELAARAVHYLGCRASQPFVPVNCGAIPDNLVENEFFGHARGAFTGARDHHTGLVASADGGTLFLDEIECLSLRAQVTLLRFLQDQSYRPLGGKQPMTGNVRIIAASNTDIVQLVKAGSFRQDLMYRLLIMPLTMPALRERREDVVVLARHFVRRFADRYGVPEKTLSPETLMLLTAHHWPGNVRELENLIHRGFLLSSGPILHLTASAFTDMADAPPPCDAGARVPFELGFRRAKAAVVAEFERAFLAHALSENGGNVSAAARFAGKERRAFGKLLKKYGIDADRFRLPL